MLATSAHEPPPELAEAVVLGAFLREALDWGSESVALPVSGRGLGVTLSVATRLLATLSRQGRPLLRCLQLIEPEGRCSPTGIAASLEGEGGRLEGEGGRGGRAAHVLGGPGRRPGF